MERSTPPPAVSTATNRRGLFADNEPFASGWLPPDGAHEIYYEECGAPKGKPCVILHGGPGGAINPTMRRFFDPAKWRMALFDQRGCGKSRHNASLEDNTSWTLIEDIERLREHLGVEKWCVFGGSWGSTLALAYAIRHPERVESLVLRGVFLLTARELAWFYQEGACMLFPDAWQRFCAPIPQAERGDLIAAYHKRLTHPERRVQAEAAAAWSQWEGDTISIRGPEARPPKFNEADFAVAFARIECHYFMHNSFFETDNSLLENAHKIRHIPGVIIHGRYDVVCPVVNAWDLHRAWSEAQLTIVPTSGHAAMEIGTRSELLWATEAFKSIRYER